MSVEQIKSGAFRRAALESESYRIQGLLALLGVLLVFAVVKNLATGHLRLLLAETLLLGLVIAYKVVKLVVVKRALRRGTTFAEAAWAVPGILIETQIATITLFISIESGLMSPYQMLVAPAMLVYFFFIILSTLRLSPFLSLLTGLASALGYLGVTIYTGARFPNAGAGVGAFPPTIFFIYAGLLLASGAVAAFVAGQIRVHVSAALHEAELEGELKRVNHDLDIARSIQQGLLPTRPPALSDFEIAGWNQPADETGGDYFDWQQLPDGRVAISLADATGHGIGPALVGTSCRAYARASFLAGDGKDGVLDHLNGLLAEDLASNRFVTFAVIFLDPLLAHVRVLSAGHGPILWYKRGADSVESLEAQGIPLGMIAGARYERGIEGCLAVGDILAIVTDGFSEWENPEGEQLGVARLEAVLRESRDRSAEEVIARLREEVTRFCEGTEQMDDLTVVVLKRKAVASELRESTDTKTPVSVALPALPRMEEPALQTGAQG
ncbi:MAG: PP2C family protein-serine/threonine phosphatase [Pyrinomonadaceae bacterium]